MQPKPVVLVVVALTLVVVVLLVPERLIRDMREDLVPPMQPHIHPVAEAAVLLLLVVLLWWSREDSAELSLSKSNRDASLFYRDALQFEARGDE